MISERKRAANRRNAARSTGPRTEQGKARSRLNAMKHGLAARRITLRHDEVEEHRRRLDEWEASYRPVDDVESELVARAVFASIILDRIDRLAVDPASPFDPDRPGDLRRYERSWTGILRRAMDELRGRREGAAQRSHEAPLDHRDDGRERTHRDAGEAEATSARTSCRRRVWSLVGGIWKAVSRLGAGVLRTRTGNVETTAGHEQDTRGHEQDTRGRGEDAGGHRPLTIGTRPDAETARGVSTRAPGVVNW